MRRAVAAGTVIVCLLGGAFAATASEGCNASSAQIQTTLADGLKLAGCVLAKILNGIVDPASLLGCAGATEDLIVQIVDDFTAQQQTDAGLAAVSASVTPQQRAWLQQARQNAVAALAARSGAK